MALKSKIEKNICTELVNLFDGVNFFLPISALYTSIQPKRLKGTQEWNKHKILSYRKSAKLLTKIRKIVQKYSVTNFSELKSENRNNPSWHLKRKKNINFLKTHFPKKKKLARRGQFLRGQCPLTAVFFFGVFRECLSMTIGGHELVTCWQLY